MSGANPIAPHMSLGTYPGCTAAPEINQPANACCPYQSHMAIVMIIFRGISMRITIGIAYGKIDGIANSIAFGVELGI